jgi:hypothetical protein
MRIPSDAAANTALAGGGKGIFTIDSSILSTDAVV